VLLFTGVLVISIQSSDGAQSFEITPSSFRSDRKGEAKAPPRSKCVEGNKQKNSLRLSSEDLMKLVIEKRALAMPGLLGRNQLQGIVKVEVAIDEKGTVQCVVGKSGHPLAKDSGVQSVSKWVFKPYVVNHKAKSVFGILVLPYDFRR
jgi:hypothetical protein